MEGEEKKPSTLLERRELRGNKRKGGRKNEAAQKREGFLMKRGPFYQGRKAQREWIKCLGESSKKRKRDKPDGPLSCSRKEVWSVFLSGKINLPETKATAGIKSPGRRNPP